MLKKLSIISALCLATLQSLSANASGALRDIGAPANVSMLAGEEAAASWNFFVPAAEAGLVATVDLGIETSVLSDPDRSTAVVFLNNEEVGRLALSVSKNGVQKVPVPTGAIMPGWNNVRIVASQRHRVDCSVTATYELWSAVRSASLGLSVPNSPAIFQHVSDLPALSPNAAGLRVVEIVANPTDLDEIERLFHVTRGLVDAARLQSIVVRVVDAPTEEAALVIMAVDRDTVAPIWRDTGVPGLFSQKEPNRAPVLAVAREADRESLDVLLTTARAIIDPLAGMETDAARRLRETAQVPFQPNQTPIALGDLGLSSQSFDGRFAKYSFDVTLPFDFLDANYGSGAILRLTGSHIGGLLDGSRLRVLVNNVPATTLSLRASHDIVFNKREFRLPTGMFRAGRNTVTIEATTITAEDLTCQGGAAGVRFALGQDSNFTMGLFARARATPELAGALSRQASDIQSGAFRLFVPRASSTVLSAALTVALADQDARRGIELVRGLPGPGDNGLIVGQPEDLPAAFASRFGALINRSTVDLPTKAPQEPGLVEFAIREIGGLFSLRMANTNPMERLVMTPASVVFLDVSTTSATAGLARIFYPDSVVAVVAGKPEDLQSGLEAMVAAGRLEEIAGEASVFDPVKGTVNTRAAQVKGLRSIADLTPTNLRYVTAGFLSMRVTTFVLTVLGLVLLLGTMTYVVVRRSGVRHDA
jgi:hypothetical protein